MNIQQTSLRFAWHDSTPVSRNVSRAPSSFSHRKSVESDQVSPEAARCALLVSPRKPIWFMLMYSIGNGKANRRPHSIDKYFVANTRAHCVRQMLMLTLFPRRERRIREWESVPSDLFSVCLSVRWSTENSLDCVACNEILFSIDRYWETHWYTTCRIEALLAYVTDHRIIKELFKSSMIGRAITVVRDIGERRLLLFFWE